MIYVCFSLGKWLGQVQAQKMTRFGFSETLWLQMTTLLRLGERLCHRYNNKRKVLEVIMIYLYHVFIMIFDKGNKQQPCNNLRSQNWCK